MKKIKNEEVLDPCLLIKKLTQKQSGLFKLQGMALLLTKFPELRKTCGGCSFYKDLPPKFYICKRFFCTNEKV